MQGRPAEPFRRLRVQARQAYSYAAAAALGWRGPWREAIDKALAYLEAHHRREDGLYRALVRPDGSTLDETALLYDQAFVLIGLAAAARAMPERRRELEIEARGLLDRIVTAFRCESGGYRERDFLKAPPRYGLSQEGEFQSNATMHLFEATLAWAQLGGDERWTAVAAEIGTLCCARFFDPATGGLSELFDGDWRPAAGEAGGIRDPGHHQEWAWLLEQWSWVSGRPDAAETAARLFEAGERGVDPGRGVLVDSLREDFTPRERTARLWPQTERLKAAHILARRGDPGRRETYLAAAREAAGALSSFIQTPLPGLWRDRLLEGGDFAEGPAPASSLYHIISAIAELGDLRIVPAPDAQKSACAV